MSGLALAAVLSGPARAVAPPAPPQPVPVCGATIGGTCFVGGAFAISATSPGAHHYAVCRSNDTSGWGGCNQLLTANTPSNYTVSGTALPSDGFSRAYYFSACDAADACSDWAANPEAYVSMDASGPTAPGPTTVSCAYTVSDNCWVTGDFMVSVTAATDAGAGVSGYQICRSNDVPSGWAGCEVNLTLTGGTSMVVTGAHLPSEGSRRAYYFRPQDAVGNWGAGNNPRYVRVDRSAPAVSATNASDQWFTSRTATLAAADNIG